MFSFKDILELNLIFTLKEYRCCSSLRTVVSELWKIIKGLNLNVPSAKTQIWKIAYLLSQPKIAVLKCRRLVIKKIGNIILKTRKESGIYNKLYINIVNDRKRLTYLSRAYNITEFKTSYSSEIICKGLSLIMWGNLMAIELHVKRIHTDSYNHR